MSETLLALVCSTADDGRSGIYSYAYDGTDGGLTSVGETDVEHPMYLATHPEFDVAYVANRTDGGRLDAFALDRAGGTLTRLVGRSSRGVGPCYVSVDGAGRFAFVANYGGGSVAMYSLDGDGRPGAAADVVRRRGSGADPDRQSEPHPHAIVPGPADRFAYVPDLGTDEVAVYRIDGDADRLVPADPPAVDLPPGTGPRHLGFEPSGEYGYLVGELNSTLTMLSRDAGSGALSPVETVGTLPDDATVDNAPADVHVHPTGRWVYVSNRGHDSVATFAVDGGRLAPRGHVGTGGENPRDVALAPGGRYLFAENRDTDTVAAFCVGDDGSLVASGRRAVPKPTCLEFV